MVEKIPQLRTLDLQNEDCMANLADNAAGYK